MQLPVTNLYSIRPSIVIFTTIILIGQGIFAFSAYKDLDYYGMALAGRIIYGIGA